MCIAELCDLGIKRINCNWWTDTYKSELVDDCKINVETVSGIVLWLSLLSALLAFTTTDFDDAIILFVNGLDLAILKLLLNILSVILCDHALFSLLGNFFRTLWHKSFLGLELIEVLDELIASFNFLIVWILSVFDFSLLSGDSVFLII